MSNTLLTLGDGEGYFPAYRCLLLTEHKCGGDSVLMGGWFSGLMRMGDNSYERGVMANMASEGSPSWLFPPGKTPRGTIQVNPIILSNNSVILVQTSQSI